jgi:tripartite-type tricarboxylate transporter receptor subunit TctC
MPGIGSTIVSSIKRKFGARARLLGSTISTVAVILAALSGHAAWCQTARTIKIVVPYTPGGGADTLTRLLADQIGRTQGTTMVIENRPGAGTGIATEAVARAAPDGNTLLIADTNFLIIPHFRKLNYDPRTSFEPICQLVISPQIVVVNGASPYRTLADLLDAARARPGDLTLASVGPASLPQIGFEMLKRAANVDITFVPYPGVAAAVNALLGGHVTSVFTSYASVGEQLKAGQLRALATTTRMRIDPLPDVPTGAEAGYKDLEADLWDGVVAPANTPKEIVAEIAGWFTTALREPETKRKLVAQGLFPVGTCGADFGALIRKQYDEYGRVVREANLRAE